MPITDASEKSPSTNNSPNERPTLQSSSRSHSASNRFSIASTETGESSRSASTRASTLLGTSAGGDNDTSQEDQRNMPPPTNTGSRDGKPSHRSRQSRSGGGFLLSNTAFGTLAPNDHTSARHGTNTNRPGDSIRDIKGKSSKDRSKRRSSIGLGIVGSPLASNVTTVETGEGTEARGSNLQQGGPSKKDISKVSQASSTGLDIDSAQIVNLALNLSENRKLAARRNISTPIPSSTPVFDEALAGGSLKYHLHQQRRSSRNVSPKPEKVDRAHNTSPRLLTSGQRNNTGFRSLNSPFPDGEYQYNFSPSTLARAEKARNSIELMAQYRRLLQYVPPLKPTGISAPQPYPTPPGTSSHSQGSISGRPVSAASNRALGRQYNPLQYIRNRKLRARERRTLDGESEGFGNVDRVKEWVDQISSESVQQGYGTSDVVPIPPFSDAAVQNHDSAHDSPQPSASKTAMQAKYKRPRMDWTFAPEDLLSDLHWLEQGENKKRIEDREGRKIFPQHTLLKRPTSRESHEPMSEATESVRRSEDSASDRLMEAELPKFKSVRPETTRGRARQKLHDTIHGNHRSSGSFSEGHRKNRSESDGSRSEDESHHRGIGRSRSREPPEPGRNLLEKQLMELLAQEARESANSNASGGNGGLYSSTTDPQTPHKEKAHTLNSAESSGYDAKTFPKKSQRKTDSREFASGRPSLEVPHARASFETFDSTAPNSPFAKASHPDGFIPSINMNLSPSHSRASSPTRKPLHRVRSKISKLRDRSRHPTNELSSLERLSFEEERSHDLAERPDASVSPEKRRRSISPTKKLMASKTGSSSKSLRREESFRRKKGEDDSSGLRGFIKGSRDIVRGPVAQVKDLLWRKEASPGSVDSYASSSDDSDDEATSFKKLEKKKRRNSTLKNVDDSTPEATPISKSYLKDMPSFQLSRDRNRPPQLKTNETTNALQDSDHFARQRRTLSNARSPRFDLLKPPRIDVQAASPKSSPEFPPTIRQTSHESDVSDAGSRRNSYVGRLGLYGADKNPNAILGLPGRLLGGPPMTALARASLEHGSHNQDHSHSENVAEGHRPSIGSRQWSISDRAPSSSRGPITKREIARVRALLMSSGVKAKEIGRREEERISLRDASKSAFSEVATTLVPEEEDTNLPMIPKYQEHALAAHIISNDMQLSSHFWQSSASTFSSTTIPELTSRINALKENVTGPEGLTAMCRRSADEADALGRELVGEKTMAVKRLTDAMEMMERRRRRRFRWVRRGGWVVLEWVLVGVMWWVWLVVVLIRTVKGLGGAMVGGLRWLFWL